MVLKREADAERPERRGAKHRRRHILLSLLIIVIVLSCLLASRVLTAPSTLEPASGYLDGRSEAPPGHYLFLEYVNDVRGWGASLTAPCPRAVVDGPWAYAYYSDALHVGSATAAAAAMEGRDRPVGLLGYHESWYYAAGGSGDRSDIQAIPSLPHEVGLGSQARIHMVDSDGTVAVTVEGQTGLLRPGQSWQKRLLGVPGLRCQIITTYTLINHGLLDKQHIAPYGD